MLIHEVCKKCSLTRKAIEYYMEQKLISPAVQKNNYRHFSDEDVAKLKKITALQDISKKTIRDHHFERKAKTKIQKQSILEPLICLSAFCALSS